MVVWLCGCTVARACGVVFVVATLRFSVLNICRKVRIGCRPIDMNKVALQRGEPAVLLTDDADECKEANENGVPAISMTVLNNYLLRHRSNGQN